MLKIIISSAALIMLRIYTSDNLQVAFLLLEYFIALNTHIFTWISVLHQKAFLLSIKQA